MQIWVRFRLLAKLRAINFHFEVLLRYFFLRTLRVVLPHRDNLKSNQERNQQGSGFYRTPKQMQIVCRRRLVILPQHRLLRAPTTASVTRK